MKQEAQEAERQFLIGKPHARIDITFEDLHYQYLKHTKENIKDSTVYTKISRAKNHISNYFGDMNIHDINITSVFSWKEMMNDKTHRGGKKYSLKYKRNLMIELRAVLKYGTRFYGLKENVASIVNDFKDKDEKVVSDEEKIRYITPKEYNLFASVIENIVFKVFFAFLYYMGVRKGEAQALTWEDFNFENNTVRIIKTITNKTEEVNESGFRFKITNTKNRKNRTIKIPSALKNMLLELHKYYSEFEGFNNGWFAFGGDRHLASQTIDNHKDHYFELVKEMYGININRITNHEFRHSHASYLISKGVRIELIAYRLGDTVEVVSSVYTHLFPEVEDEIMDELDLIDNYCISLGTKKEFLKALPTTKILVQT